MLLYDEMLASQMRERQRILNEATQIRGLMPTLMKPRNGQHWTLEERREIVFHLRELAGLSPYLVPLVMPGGILLLPVLAWWLDRRRGARKPQLPDKL